MRPHVLLIEDDPRIREIVERGIGTRGFAVSSAGDAQRGLELAGTLAVDLVVLDLLLPDDDGLHVLEHIRAAKPRLPVIALTALDDLDSKLASFGAGADDYMTKPFSIAELAARIEARLRWREDGATLLQAGPLKLDLATHQAALGARQVPLSARESSLLAAFLRHPRQVLSRERLLRLVWQIDFDPGSNVVDVYVSALRRKLGPGVIETVRGLGYRLGAEEAAAR